MPIPDEQARVWTRFEDYWPSRRSARSRRSAATRRRNAARGRGDPTDKPRLSLGIIPFMLLILGMGVLAVAIMVVAWPGRRGQYPARPTPAAEVGTAAPGWIAPDPKASGSIAPK